MNRQTFVVSIDSEHAPATNLVQAFLNEALAQTKRFQGAKVHVYKFGDLETAIANLAREIKQSGQDAVDERIR